MAKVGKRLLKITVAATDYTAEVSKAVITSGESESDFVTFADAAAGGGRTYKLAFTAAQDHATGTLWDKVFSSAGSTVACILKPYGNATATPTQPHYGFDAVVTEPDGDFIGGEADKSVTAVQVIECEWTLTAKPTKITT
jgi:hypothetical protein